MPTIHTSRWTTGGLGYPVRVEVDKTWDSADDAYGFSIDVTLDACLTPDETRRLITDLQHALSLTEEA